ncbi:MAG: tRNA-guanine transglycosylase [Parcubacteria group bacterium Athens1014_10]|nr:MAG: tRNA-guanine transglycosylase [Parcubacteria group bacterium Athens1014_10]TSD05008.1 MAG: tRNA-guanine transglycosylase [Parcubacteria group bacterium Athens0714_12]
MPIATKGVVKTLSVEDLKNLKARIILSNTYHLMLKPGIDLIKKAGGLHKFMNWLGPILTDSGGFQVFSLSKIRKIKERGVMFNSIIDGKKYFLTPEKAIKIQEDLGSDIVMALDECTSYPCDYEYAKKSIELTFRWAKRCKEAKEDKSHIFCGQASPFCPKGSPQKVRDKKQLLFGITQGSVYKDLRIKSAKQIVSLDFDGYALGGLAVGEPAKKMLKVLDYTIPLLPQNKPHYLMGVGRPEQIIEAVKRGIDMFDCVIPTREARHNRLYLWQGKADITKKNFYKVINIASSKFKADLLPINQGMLKKYSKAYLYHLFKTKEPLALRLATLNNLEFYLNLMLEIRRAIKRGMI